MESLYLDRTDDVIKQEMLEETDDKVLKMAGTFINDSYGPSSIKLAEVYMELDHLDSKRDVRNLYGEELDMRVEEGTGSQVARRQATHARGVIVAIGDEGATIDESTLMTIGEINYKALQGATVEDGRLEVEIECLEPGAVGNAAKGSEVSLVNNITGIHEIYLKSDAAGGFEEETDESLLERYFNYIRMPPTSGNIYHYNHWAKQIEGVGDAKVIPLWNGDNTVKVVITDSNMETALPGLVEKVQDHIDPGITGKGEGEAPIGAYCTVVSAESKDVDIEVTLDLVAGLDVSEVKGEVFANINKYMRGLTFSDSEVSYAKVGAAILLTDGVKDYKELKINGGKSNLELKNEETAVLREVIINE